LGRLRAAVIPCRLCGGFFAADVLAAAEEIFHLDMLFNSPFDIHKVTASLCLYILEFLSDSGCEQVRRRRICSYEF
jgi:hypothetical protein